MIGITSYGFYTPALRVKVSEIAKFWSKSGEDIAKSLGVFEKSVPQIDEDAVTLSVESAKVAIKNGKVKPADIDTIIIGSESHPYAVKPTATTVAEILGMGADYLALDTEFACKAATGALQLVLGLAESRRINHGLVIGSDTAQASKGDALEYTAASASTSLIIGREEVIAKVLGFTSISSNTPDFWRRDGQEYPSHGGRFTGEPAYFAHVLGASEKLLGNLKLKTQDFQHAVFHMPNGKFPKEAAKKLGFTEEQISQGFIVPFLGNPYSASAISGLAAILDIAKPGQKIFLCSYGSGAGSDAFAFQVTREIVQFQKRNKHKVMDQLNQKKYISYPEILKRL